MKKIYSRPEIRNINIQIECLFTTDSRGLKNRFKSREASFSDDEENESTAFGSTIWDE